MSRCGAGLGQGDIDRRQVEVRQIRHRQLPVALEARQREQDEEQDGRNRIADRPSSEIHGAYSFTTRTASPSFRKPAPCTTTLVPAPMADRISTESPWRRPMVTACMLTWSPAASLAT
ncbi:hypothetical protein ACPWZ5_12650 [Ralstonia pseudosolanacearum]|uniref:hypothetical protein n=1 Tax=Ralstonia pseudosolanacearum TaxID=1310165 RepID=UPI003CF2F371